MFYIETISNPLLEVPDIAAVAAFCQDHNITSVIDNTFASPVVFRLPFPINAFVELSAVLSKTVMLSQANCLGMPVGNQHLLVVHNDSVLCCSAANPLSELPLSVRLECHLHM